MLGWDTDAYPDYRMFLETAKKVNANLILFAAATFDVKEEIDDQLEELETAELPRDDRRNYERRLKEYRKHDGATCAIEMAFDHNSRFYIYEVASDWYEEFMELTEEIETILPPAIEEDESGMGGFYSNN